MESFIQQFSSKNPDKQDNQDLIGMYHNVYWLLDGASTPTKIASEFPPVFL